MGKKFLLILACCAFLFAGCDAFKDYYDEVPEEVLNEAESVQEEEEKSASKSAIVDYTVDETSCANVAGLMTSLIPEIVSDANEGFSTEASVLAEKIGEHTTKIIITKGTKRLSFKIKKVADDIAHVCNVVYEDCEGECVGIKNMWSKVEEGSLEIYELSEDDINSGSYEITFSESAMGHPGITIEGSYFTDILE